MPVPTTRLHRSVACCTVSNLLDQVACNADSLSQFQTLSFKSPVSNFQSLDLSLLILSPFSRLHFTLSSLLYSLLVLISSLYFAVYRSPFCSSLLFSLMVPVSILKFIFSSLQYSVVQSPISPKAYLQYPVTSILLNSLQTPAFC